MAINFGSAAEPLVLPADVVPRELLLGNLPERPAVATGEAITLQPWEALVLRA